MEEEIVVLEEQLAAAHADVERLQTLLAEAETTVANHESDGAELRRQLGLSRRELEEAQSAMTLQAAEVEAARSSIAGIEAKAAAAVARYREAMLAAAPDLPADLVDGDSVEAVDEALGRARQTVARVRQHLEQQAQALRVPAGAPVRAGPELSDLSPAEKIRLGLQQSNQ